jgi:hypothetical protein
VRVVDVFKRRRLWFPLIIVAVRLHLFGGGRKGQPFATRTQQPSSRPPPPEGLLARRKRADAAKTALARCAAFSSLFSFISSLKKRCSRCCYGSFRLLMMMTMKSPGERRRRQRGRRDAPLCSRIIVRIRILVKKYTTRRASLENSSSSSCCAYSFSSKTTRRYRRRRR